MKELVSGTETEKSKSNLFIVKRFRGKEIVNERSRGGAASGYSPH